MRELQFLGGASFEVAEDCCRGCFMAKVDDQLDETLARVFTRGGITVRQDAEWAVPGFYIVSPDRHVAGLHEMSAREAVNIAEVLRMVRLGLSSVLGAKSVHMYQEERQRSPHFHVWMLPIWGLWSRGEKSFPQIYESNIPEYLRSFDFIETRQDILTNNRLMSEYLTNFDGS